MNNKPQFPKKKITIMGIGGGGINILKYFNSDKYFEENDNLYFDLISICTNKEILKMAAKKQILIGSNGIGCGGNVEKGKNAASECKDKIIKELKNTDVLIILTCLGGGTGTGASITISKLAKELDIKTVVFATIPFSFEGEKRHLKAMEGVDELKNFAEVHLFENDTIVNNLPKNATAKESFNFINKQILDTIKKNSMKYFNRNS